MKILQDYTLFHKIVVITFWAIGFAAIVRAILMFTGGSFELRSERIIDTSVARIWPYIYKEENRHRWTVYLYDIARLTSSADKMGSTRMVFFRKNSKRWSGAELTEQVVQERLYQTFYETQVAKKRLRFELTPLGDCSTRIEYKETIYPIAFWDRYWFMFARVDETQRLHHSLESLEKWALRDGKALGDTLSECRP